MSGIMYKNRPYAGGGGAGGASALSDLTDTNINNPVNGQVLKYNNGFWENGNESGGTTVVANPAGTPTEELSTIQIGQSIYEIAGESSGQVSALAYRELTPTQYANLTTAEKNNGTVYFVSENATGANGYKIIVISRSAYEALSTADKNNGVPYFVHN